MSAMTLTAQTSRVNSSISSPRLTPLRMIERNRNTDKTDITRLENKIKALENSIVIAKQQGEEKRLDKLENSLKWDKPLLEEENTLLDDTPKGKGKIEYLLPATSTKKDLATEINESCLHEDELAFLNDLGLVSEHLTTEV